MIAAVVLATACAGGPRPGDAGYAYNVDGLYSGRVMVDGEPFDATLELGTSVGGRVRGSFGVRAPLSIEGEVEGRVVDDLVRLTLTYEGAGGDGATACEGRLDGILTVSPGGDVLDGPVTISDCGDAIAGRVSFRRAPGGR